MTPLQNRIEHHQTEIRILESEISKLLEQIGEKRNKVDEHKEAIERIQNKIG